mgnify:FL=1
MDLITIILVAVIAFIAGYYSKNNKQVLQLKEVMQSAENTILEFSGNYDLKNEKVFLEKEIRENKGRIVNLKKELEDFNNTELETAKHKKWKEEKAEKTKIIQIEKQERKAEIKALNEVEKPDFLK